MTPKWTFRVENDVLVYEVKPPHGNPYAIRVPRKVLEEIAFIVDESGDEGITAQEAAAKAKATGVQATAAFAFLNDTWCIEKRGRRWRRTTTTAHLDVMCRFEAMAVGAELHSAGDEEDER